MRHTVQVNATPSENAAPPDRPWLARLDPALFGIALGLLGLSGAWLRLTRLGAPGAAPMADALLWCACVLLAALLLLWCFKLKRHPHEVLGKWRHPVLGPLLALLPVSVLMCVASLAPRLATDAVPALMLVVLLALVLQGTLAWQVVARLSTGRIDQAQLTPALYLPTVTGGFVGAMAMHNLHQHGFGVLLLGMGVGAWALLEIRILNRLFSGPLPPTLRPTLGMEMAPACVGTLASSVLWPDLPADVLVIMLGVASGPVFAVLTRWRYWTEVPFVVGFWSFSFPLAAMSAAVAETVRRGQWPMEVAVAAVVIASAVIGFLVLRTLALMLGGRLLPAA